MTHSVFEKNRSVEEEVSHTKPASTVPGTMGQRVRSPSLPVVNLKAVPSTVGQRDRSPSLPVVSLKAESR